jgi:hypothetical protein
MKNIEKYQRAVETGDEALLKEVFAAQVRVDVPAGPSVTYPANTASYILSQVARTAPGIKCTLTAGAGSHWYLLGFEGELEGRKLQAIDQVHLNSDGKIDQLIIYMRPLSVAQTFAAAIGQRLQPTT